MNQCQMHHDSPSFNLWLILWSLSPLACSSSMYYFVWRARFLSINIVLTTNYLLFNNPPLFKTHQPQWVNSVDHCQLLALKTKLLNTFNNFIFCPCFTPSRIALAERARETVSLFRGSLCFNSFFFFVSSERLDDIHVTWFDRFLRRKGDSTALQ